MENVRTVALTVSVPVAVLSANSARKGFKIENLHVSNPVLVRGYVAPVLATVAGVKHILFTALPTGGTFKIRFTDLQTGAQVTTTALAAGASNATVQTAVRLLAGYGSVTVADPDAGIGYKLTLTSGPVPEARLSIESSTVEVAGTAEAQTLTIPNGPGSDTPAEGSFRVLYRTSFGSVGWFYRSAAIAYDVTASALQSILRACFMDEALTVAGSWASAFTVTFGVKEPKQLMEVSSTMKSAGDAETQLITFSAAPEAGSFKLQYGATKSTAIAFGDNATAVQVALRTISVLSSVTVAGNMTIGFTVTMTGISGNPALLVVTDNSLAVSDVDEIQLVAHDEQPFAGQFKLQYGATKTGFIAFGASAGTVQTALRTISGLGSVTVTGDNSAGYEVTFAGVVGNASMLAVTDSTLAVSDDVEVQNVAWTSGGSAPTAGHYKLQYSGVKSTFINWDADKAAVQVALRTIPALATVTVDDLNDMSLSGFVITFAGIVGDASLLVLTDNTLTDTDMNPVVPAISTVTPGTSSAVGSTVTEETQGTDIEVTVTPSETLAGGKKKLVPVVARTIVGVTAIPVDTTVVLTTAGDLKALAASIAGGATLDKSDGQTRTAVYALSETSGTSIKVTEVF